MNLDNEKYANMQKNMYNKIARSMTLKNHKEHNSNPDLYNILFSDVEKYKNGIALDFGCGGGRNIENLFKLTDWERVDGVDISSNIIEGARRNLQKLLSPNKYNLYTNSGVDVSILKDNSYDLIISTIVLQHICVYDIRFSLLKDLFRTLKNGGQLSFQMGFGRKPQKRTIDYYENVYDATTTNGNCDVVIESENQIIDYLKKIGYIDIETAIRPVYTAPASMKHTFHEKWIYIKAHK